MDDKNNFLNESVEYILLLGETGVGKSTFINSLYNYFHYKTFEDAEKGKLHYKIPAQFNMKDADKNKVNVKIGSSDGNENFNLTKAGTIKPKSHLFEIGDRKIMFIDTPGFGDPDGIEHDKENIDNILKHLYNYNKINAICILLKCGQIRHDKHFCHCFKEPFVYLPKNATPNIIFCFTHSSGLMEADTDTCIENLIEKLESTCKAKIPFGEQNTFYFDNIAFRYFAAIKQGLSLNKKDRDQVAESWKMSAKNAHKLMNYICNLPTHNVDHTLKLNKVRQILMMLAKPLAEISQNIQVNIKLAEDKQKELSKTDFRIADLKDKLYMEQIEFKPVKLLHPRTVCRDALCCELIRVGSVYKCVYKTHCHDKCKVKGITADTINNPSIAKCEIINKNGYCTVCSHHYLSHLHITYEIEETSVKKIDKHVRKMIEKGEENKNILNATINSIADRIDKYKNEQKIILDMACQFAKFTQDHAILVFNDALEEYIDLLIDEEVMKSDEDGYSNEVLNGLKKFRTKYKEKINFLNETLHSARQCETINVDKVDELIKEMCELDLSGKKITAVINKIILA